MGSTLVLGDEMFDVDGLIGLKGWRWLGGLMEDDAEKRRRKKKG